MSPPHLLRTLQSTDRSLRVHLPTQNPPQQRTCPQKTKLEKQFLCFLAAFLLFGTNFNPSMQQTQNLKACPKQAQQHAPPPPPPPRQLALHRQTTATPNLTALHLYTWKNISAVPGWPGCCWFPLPGRPQPSQSRHLPVRQQHMGFADSWVFLVCVCV